MRTFALLFAALSLIATLAGFEAAASARPRLRVFIVGAVAGDAPRSRAVQAKLGERVRLFAVVQRRERGRWRSYSDAPAGTRLRRRRLRRVRPLSALAGLSLRWARVEPRMHHVKTASPNKGQKTYSNSVLYGSRHGRWIGFDTLEYFETPMKARGGSIAVTRTRPKNKRVNVNGGLGTMRYRVYARLGALEVSSPGARATLKRGVSPRVFRVSFRESDDWIGYLTAYFNVPNVFGSAGGGRTHQTDRFQGADCADVLVGAARLASGRIPYTSVAGLKRYARAITGKLYLDKTGLYELRPGNKRGKPVRLGWGRGKRALRRGDIMLIDYVGFTGSSRSWDHVAALRRDAGTRGRFDPKDRVMHMSNLRGLIDASAGSEGPAIVKFLRFRRRYRRAFARNARRQARARAWRGRRARR